MGKRNNKRMRNALRALGLIGLTIAALIGVTACGSSSSSSSSSSESTTSSSGGSTTASANGGAEGLGEAEAEIAKYEEHPTFEAPGPEFKAEEGAAGKHVWIVPDISSVPTVTEVEKSLEPALEAAGAEVSTESAEGAVSEWVTDMNTAISQNADAIVDIGIQPSQIAAPVAKAKAAGIPVIYMFASTSDEVEPNVAGNVPIDYPLFAKLLADGAAVETEGKAKTAIFYTNQLPQDEPTIEEVEARFSEICPECKVETTQDIPEAQWATNTTGDARSTLTAHPEVNVLMPVHDQLAEFMVPALRSANKIGEIKLITNDGTASAIQQIKTGAITSDLGWSNAWIGWAAADQTLRALAGVPTVKDEKLGYVLFDSTNTQEISNADDVNGYFGNSYEAGYEKLWELK